MGGPYWVLTSLTSSDIGILNNYLVNVLERVQSRLGEYLLPSHLPIRLFMSCQLSHIKKSQHRVLSRRLASPRKPD